MTVSLQGTEPIAQAIITKLQAGLTARIATINAEFTDLTITAPTVFYVGGFPNGLAPEQPTIVITELPSDEFGETGAEGPHSFVYTPQIGVFVYELDTDRQNLTRKLWRQSRAVRETIWDDDPPQALDLAGGSRVYDIRPIRVIPGPVFDVNNDQTLWTALYGVIFRARLLEG